MELGVHGTSSRKVLHVYALLFLCSSPHLCNGREQASKIMLIGEGCIYRSLRQQRVCEQTHETCQQDDAFLIYSLKLFMD